MSTEHTPLIEVRLAPEQFTCSICGFPSHTQRGRDMHETRAHSRSSRAERNWSIAHMFYVEGASAAELAELFELSQASVRSILWRAMVFPQCYDLAEAL